jgi:SNF2 family DNA or RNA helicase
MKAFHNGQELVPVQGGGWAPLPVDWLAQYGEIISDLLATKEMGEALPKCLLPDLGRLCAALEHPAPPELAAFEQLVGDFDGLPEASLPDDLLATLRGYQKKGVDWLNFLKTAGMGGLLADDMGLGKTIQALCAMNGRSLVVAPTSVLHNWQSEIERFRPSLSINLYHGSGRQLDASANVTLTTYAILRLDVDALSEVSWNMVVLDEAQAIKNPSSQVAQGAFRLQGDFKLTLTGTPVENRLEELWSQMHFINPGLLGANSHFKKHYVKPISSGDRAVSERLRRRIKPFILRRLKSEVAPELPPRTEQVLHCVLSEEERKLYESIVATTRAEVVAKFGKGGNAFAALEALLRLRQAACHPQLVSQSGGGTRSAKLTLMMERLDAMVAEGHKALVFSQWTSLLDKVEPLLNEAGIKFVRLDGSTRDRQGVVSTFQSDKGPPVMLLSLKAGGTGLNLTAADHVILLDPWWNPAAEDQAADRAHRIGQDKPVLIYRLVAKNTVEERVLLLQDKKRALADAVLSGSDGAASLTRDDLMWLLD